MREKFFYLLLFAGFGILLVRLFVLQIVQGAYWRDLAEGNRIRVEKIPALRGVVYDRNDKLLVRNTPEGREYLYPEILAHVLGYIGQASPEEVEDFGYKLGDWVGKMGIEKQYDLLLRGADGGVLEEVDAGGKQIRLLGKKEPQNGESLKLTIDLGLQQKAWEVIKDAKGAVVVSKPQTGEILVLLSSPSFDPNIFTQHRKEIENILSNKDQPMFARSISGLYPPGSTFKIVSAIAGLQEGKINESTQVEDTGKLNVGIWSFGNWYFLQYGKTEGWLDLVNALKRSNDIFFYRVGEWLGIEKLSAWAKKMGYGQATGIDLPGEAGGLVPDKTWKKEVKGETWYLGDDFITAIGQGDLLATPLQVNTATSIFAANGQLCRPYLWGEKICRNLGIKQEYLDLVKEGMKGACSEGGTGWPLFNFKVKNENIKFDKNNFFGPTASDSADTIYIPVACKTGSAEATGKENKSHAWFTAFAPIEDPEIVVTVLVENGGEGSSVAGPLTKEILKWWFENEHK